MAYTREELDWIEAEWAFHLHGRSAFLSAEDFRVVAAWEADGVGAESIVAAMGAYFERRAKRPRPRAFVAMVHLAKDVAKAAKFRLALLRAETPLANPPAAALDEALRRDPKAVALYEAWRRVRALAPAPDLPGFLDHVDLERTARREFIGRAEALLGPRLEGGRQDLEARLQQAGIALDSPVGRRAFEHHWGKMVLEAYGIADG